MKRRQITHTQIIALTQEVLRGFYSRDTADLFQYLHENFVWIGAFDFQYTTGILEFQALVQTELTSVPLIMSGEHYEVINRDRDSIVVCCKCVLDAILPDGSHFHSHTRLTVIWKYVNGVPKIIHIHGSNAQDIPLISDQEDKSAVCDSFVKYINQSNAPRAVSQIMVRLTTGEHRMIAHDDILYLSSAGQCTHFHTKTDVFLVSGILKVHQAKLPDLFHRIHKSYLINCDYLTSLCRYIVTLNDGTELPIGKERYLPLKRRFLEMTTPNKPRS